MQADISFLTTLLSLLLFIHYNCFDNRDLFLSRDVPMTNYVKNFPSPGLLKAELKSSMILLVLGVVEEMPTDFPKL